ncbi:MAG: 50S ribosomal protein L15 [Desulfovibrionaceae bacterium]
MNLHELFPFKEERRNRKRLGRGVASGSGGTSGKGHKGQNARAGGGVRLGFEGGQMPLQRRLPKHGFNNSIFSKRYEVVNLERLLISFPEKKEISLEDIYNRGLCSKNSSVKILGKGVLSAAITIEAHKFSTSAEEKIRSAGGITKSIEG